MLTCGTCGNEIAHGESPCPHCGRALVHAPLKNTARLLVVNLHDDRPTVPEGIARLHEAVAAAAGRGVRILKVIHGYGSSGVGGELRRGLRAAARALEAEGALSAMVPGENLQEARRLLAGLTKQPPFCKDPDLGRPNKGITWLRIKR